MEYIMTWLPVVTITWLSVALAFLSAAFWLASALVSIPKTAWLVSGVGGGRPSPELDAILKRLRLVSRLNFVGALLMAISVLLQGVSTALSL
jgi:hypothetical protein